MSKSLDTMEDLVVILQSVHFIHMIILDM